jgi:hypothetical protein
MAFKMKYTGFPMHEPEHKGEVKPKQRTRQDNELEKGDNKRDVWNPKKEARLTNKANSRLEKAGMTGPGMVPSDGATPGQVSRALRATDKAHAEAGKRGSDEPTPRSGGGGVSNITKFQAGFYRPSSNISGKGGSRFKK